MAPDLCLAFKVGKPPPFCLRFFHSNHQGFEGEIFKESPGNWRYKSTIQQLKSIFFFCTYHLWKQEKTRLQTRTLVGPFRTNRSTWDLTKSDGANSFNLQSRRGCTRPMLGWRTCWSWKTFHSVGRGKKCPWSKQFPQKQVFPVALPQKCDSRSMCFPGSIVSFPGLQRGLFGLPELPTIQTALLSRWFSDFPVWWDMWSLPGGYIIFEAGFIFWSLLYYVTYIVIILYTYMLPSMIVLG